MLPALHDDDRRALARLATMLIIGALSVLPVTTQSSSVAGAAGVRDVTNDANLMVPAHLTFPAYEISRDPFVPAGPMRTKLDGNATAMSVGQGGDIGVVLPPNAGASQSGARPGVPTGMTMGSILRAIVLGDPPRALVEAGGAVRVVGVGDHLGELKIVGITPGHVALSDGSSLILDGARR